MKRVKILERIQQAGLIAVVRAKDEEQACQTIAALVAGGMTGMEITMTVPGALDVLKKLKEAYKDTSVLLGAGTVLDGVTARLAILAGADFIVSPAFDEATAHCCNHYQIPYLPGCVTLTEMQTALKAGVDIVKLFPGSLAGPEYLKAIHAPLPQVNVMPTGGVSLENVGEWLAAGAVAVGVGGKLVAPAEVGDYAKVTQLAADYQAVLNDFRGGKQ